MTELQNVGVSATGGSVLHRLVRLIADENVRQQIDSTRDILDMYRAIEDKTDEDIDRIEQGERGLEALCSPTYLQEVENILTEGYSRLDPKYQQRMLDEILMEMAISEVGAFLTPALIKLQNDFVYGTFKKPTLQ